jgi:hypothetical protein
MKPVGIRPMGQLGHWPERLEQTFAFGPDSFGWDRCVQCGEPASAHEWPNSEDYAFMLANVRDAVGEDDQ